jgi:hypothetical protein
MGFHDEAREIARQKQAEMQEQPTGDQVFMKNMRLAFPEMEEQDEQWRSGCTEKVLRWFDKVGMLPPPELGTPKIQLRPKRYSSNYDDTESCVRITWQFEGYEYRASCTSRKPESSPEIEISVSGMWFPANTKAAIGWALIKPRSIWGVSPGSGTKNVSPPPDLP